MKYEDKPKRPIDANCHCYSQTEEVFLFSAQEIFELCHDTEQEPQALELVHTQETQLYELTADYWDDAMHCGEDGIGELPTWLFSEINQLNEKIRARPGTGLYEPVNVAVELTDEFMDDWLKYKQHRDIP